MSADGHIHASTGWTVDPDTGAVYGARGRHRGRQLGTQWRGGYLRSMLGGKTYLLHRVVWEASVGPIPKPLTINHKNGVKADNRLVNLEVVTQGENNRHARAMGLHRQVNVYGPAHHSYKVTPEMHAAIIRLWGDGMTKKAIAKRFDVSSVTVYRVLRGDR